MNIDPLIFGNIPTGKLVSAPLREAATGVSFLAEVQQGFLTGELQEPSPVQPQGLGGRTTALSAAILTQGTHIAGLPCAVNLGCHVTRHAHGAL